MAVCLYIDIWMQVPRKMTRHFYFPRNCWHLTWMGLPEQSVAGNGSYDPRLGSLGKMPPLLRWCSPFQECSLCRQRLVVLHGCTLACLQHLVMPCHYLSFSSALLQTLQGNMTSDPESLFSVAYANTTWVTQKRIQTASAEKDEIESVNCAALYPTQGFPSTSS